MGYNSLWSFSWNRINIINSRQDLKKRVCKNNLEKEKNSTEKILEMRMVDTVKAAQNIQYTRKKIKK